MKFLLMTAVKEHRECFIFLVEDRLMKAVKNREKYEVFIDAARRGEFDLIQKTLVENIDKDVLTGWKGNNLMSLFIVYGCPPSCLQVLVDKGVNVNGVDYNGLTPLMCAVLSENVTLVRFLLGLGVNVNIGTVDDTSYFLDDGATKPQRHDGRPVDNDFCTTALMYAACFRNNEILREMVQYCSANDVNINRFAHSQPWRAIDYAAYFGNCYSVSLLIKSGCWVGGNDQMSYMSIHHFAMRNHRPDILELTMAAESDEYMFGLLFDRVDVCVCDVDCLRIILKYVNKSNERHDHLRLLLHVAIRYGTTDCFRLLLEQGPEINYYSGSILFALCLDEHMEKWDIFLKWGANIHLQDYEGNTAVMCAAENKAVKCLGVLISNGGSIHARNHKGETALMFACASGDFGCVDILIKSGADISAQNNEGCTAIAYVSRLKCLQELIEHGADIHTNNKQEKTSLMFACERGFEEIVEFLIRQGLNINAQDKSGKTAMMYAVTGPYVSGMDKCHGVKECGNDKCLKLLLDAGADVNLRDNERATAFSLAMCHKGRCVDLLSEYLNSNRSPLHTSTPLN